MNYSTNLFRALYSYHHKKTKVFSYPMITHIEVTNACNLSCPFCPRDKIRERGIGYMTIETFKRIVNSRNARMLRHIRMFGHGESLLHPKLVEYVKLVRPHAKSVGLTTNVQLLTKTKAKELLEAGLDIIVFSFEGVNKEAYERMRVGGNFETAVRNIVNFVDMRNAGGYKCRIVITCLDCKETHSGIERFVGHWSQFVDVVGHMSVHDWGGILSSPLVNMTPIETHRVCFWPWFGFDVYWNGSVAPCCMYETDVGLGNVNDSSLTEIWNSPEYQQFRWNMLYNQDELPICRTCRLNKLSDAYLRTVQTPNPRFPFTQSSLNLLRDGVMKIMRAPHF